MSDSITDKFLLPPVDDSIVKEPTKEQIEEARLRLPDPANYYLDRYHVVLIETFKNPLELEFMKTDNGWIFNRVW